MKILIIGSDKVYAIENIYFKYLKDLGLDVLKFNSQTHFYDFYFKSIFNKILYRLGLSNILKKINKEIIKIIDYFEPEILFVFKGMEVYPSTLQYAKTRGIKLVNYNPDNPFVFTGYGSGNKNITKSIGLYNLYLTYDWEIINLLNESFKIKTALLPFGYELPLGIMSQLNAINEIKRVCFIGNPDKERAEFILQLALNEIPLTVIGNHWKEFVSHYNIEIKDAVYGNEFWMKIYQYRVQLNLMRIHNLDSHNMRTFEIPAVGGIQLAPYTHDHKLFFIENKEIFLFKNLNECIEKINYLMSLPLNEVKKIRKFSSERSLYCGYSYFDRTIQLKKYLEEIE